MTSCVVFEEQIEVPFFRSLAEFRAWAVADDFPERGRVDYLAGRIEVDMSPEDLFCHGVLKTEIVRVLAQMVEAGDLGYLFTDRTRVSCPAADLSVEPDVVFISHESLDAGRVRLVPKASGEPGRYIEVEGAPDLIVEIVSDTSVTKDTSRLPGAYWKAGVREFWLADARGEVLQFDILRPGPAGYQPSPADAEGYANSAVFGVRFQFSRRRDARGRWKFQLRPRRAEP